MIALIQRVSEARVRVAGTTVGEIGAGLLVLVCAERGDTEAQADKLLTKVLKLRIFPDEVVAGPPQDGLTGPSGASEPRTAGSVGAKSSGKMNRSVQDLDGCGTAGGLLIVSQFTLAADVSGGNRPSFTTAAAPDDGRRLYDHVVAQARAQHPIVATGPFAADMQVQLVNDGPVTIPMTVR